MKKISRPSAAVNSPVSGNLSSAAMSSPMRAASGREISFEEATIPAQYPHKLSLYLQAPAYEITIEDFETLALSRLECN